MSSKNTYIKIITDLSILSKGKSKYIKWYISIIENAKYRNIRDIPEYTENHHIVPDCFFIKRKRKGPNGFLEGSGEHLDNLVLLTPEEHLTAHLLLIKCFNKEFKYLSSLIYAANMMFVDKNGKRITNKEYGWLKRLRSKTLSQDMQGENNHFYNKTHSEATLKHLKEIKTGKNNPCFAKIWITDGNSNKRISPESNIPENWKQGRTLSKTHIENASKNSVFGKKFFCFIHNKKCYDKANLIKVEPALKVYL
jgi:hypothetical protein